MGYTQLHSTEDDYNAPYYHIHRAEFHRLLFDLVADTHNVVLRLSATVKHIDPSEPGPSVTLATGEVVHGDLIIGADGVKSLIREVPVRSSIRRIAETPTGRRRSPRLSHAYRRRNLPRRNSRLPPRSRPRPPSLNRDSRDDELDGTQTAYHGLLRCASRNAMQLEPSPFNYFLSKRGRQAFNMGLVHPDDGSVESWTAEGSADKMRMAFADFEPRSASFRSLFLALTVYHRVQKLLAMVPSTLKWKLMDRAPLES